MDGRDTPYYDMVMGNGTPCDLLNNRPRVTHILYICHPQSHNEVPAKYCNIITVYISYSPTDVHTCTDIKKKLQTSQFMFSIRNNSLPIDFQDMFTLNSQIHSYNIRSGKLFPVALQELNFIYSVFYKISRSINIELVEQ